MAAISNFAFLSICIVSISLAYSQDNFWLHYRTTHRPIYGSPDLPEWYNNNIDNIEENDENAETPQRYEDEYYGIYDEDDEFDNYSSDDYGNVESENKDKARIQNDSPSGLTDTERDENIDGEKDEEHGEQGHFKDYRSNHARQSDLTRCPEKPNVKYYCRKLKDGLYFDPWNPWCGFIRCQDHVASRQVCADGTWMGLNNALRFNGEEMCRQRLPGTELISDSNQCPAPTDFDLCRHAKYIGLHQESETPTE